MAKKKNGGERRTLERKLAIYEFLYGRKHPVTIKDLMAEFGVTDETIRKDILDLENAGVGIVVEYDTENDNRALYKLKSQSYIRVALTRGEAHTLASTRRYWEPFAGSPFYSDLVSVIAKVIECLSPEERAAIEADHGRCLFIPDGGTKSYKAKRDIVKTFQRAVTRRRCVKYRYQPLMRDRPRSGTMEPHGIVMYKNTIYVLGRLVQSERSRKKGDTHTLEWVNWPAERFDTATLGDEFEISPDFTIESRFDGWGIIQGETTERVVVEFSPKRAHFIAERDWANTIELTHQADGWLRLVFDTKNLVEVTDWLLSHGSHLVVLKPEHLREKILREHHEAIRAFSDRK